MLRSILVLVIFLFGCGPSQEEIDIAIGSAIDNIPETITPVIILDSDHRIVLGDSEFSVELAGWQPQANVSITILSAYGSGEDYKVGEIRVNLSGAASGILGSESFPAVPENILAGIYTIRALSESDGIEAFTVLTVHEEPLEIVTKPMAPVILIDSSRKVVGDLELGFELAGWAPEDRVTISILSAYGPNKDHIMGGINTNLSGAAVEILGSEAFPAIPILPSGIYTIKAVSTKDGSEASTALRLYAEPLEVIEKPKAPGIQIDSTRKVIGDSELWVGLSGWSPNDTVKVTILAAYGTEIDYTIGSIDINLSGAGGKILGSDSYAAIPGNMEPGIYTLKAVSTKDGSEASMALQIYAEPLEVIEKPTEPDFNKIWRDTTPAIFYVQDEATGGYGTGWLYKNRYIVTANHVVNNATQMKIYQTSGLPFVASVVWQDASRDVAILKFNSSEANLASDVTPLVIGNINTGHYASPLMALGYSDRGALRNQSAGRAAANVGVLSQVKVFSHGQSSSIKHIIMDAPIAPGDSGGPVVDRDGVVIGMTRSYSTNPGTFFAIHEDVIKESLVVFFGD
tara:strand:+ start:25359 stop:27071 length:1713 start_codon:yes stop_codon:yes gene_type:complete